MALPPHIQNYKRAFWKDPSFWTLAILNIYFAIMAYKEGLANYTLIWLYWCQSVIIGIFNFLRIITLNKFSNANFKAGGSTTDMPPTRNTKLSTAFFFLVHYGFFHLVYLVFLYSTINDVDWEFVKYGAELFAVNYAFTFIFQKLWDYRHVPDIGELMFFPYLRIVPIHLTIILGGFLAVDGFFSGVSIVIFIIFKTLADLAAHVIDNMLREKRDP